MGLEDNFDNRAKKLGELIGEQIKREDPKLVGDLQSTFKRVLRKYHKPWYQKLYEQIKDFFV